ncbi:DUF2057 family protein [Aliikangiella sp. IMCC44632]
MYKNIIVIAATLFLLAISSTLGANANQTKLKVAESFNILAINGSLYQSGLVNQERNLSLRSGINKIVIEFEEVYESDDADNFDIVKSQPILINAYFEYNQTYLLRLIKPATALAARKYIKQPIFELVKVESNSALSKINFSARILNSNADSFYIQETRLKPNRVLNISSETAEAQRLPVKATPKDASKSATDSLTLEKLNYWWDLASEQEKAAFLAKIKRPAQVN